MSMVSLVSSTTVTGETVDQQSRRVLKNDNIRDGLFPGLDMELSTSEPDSNSSISS